MGQHWKKATAITFTIIGLVCAIVYFQQTSETQKTQISDTRDVSAIDCIGCASTDAIRLNEFSHVAVTFQMEKSKLQSAKLRIFVLRVFNKQSIVRATLVEEDGKETLVMALRPEENSALETEISKFVQGRQSIVVRIYGDGVEIGSPQFPDLAKRPTLVLQQRSPIDTPKSGAQGTWIVMSAVPFEDIGGAQRPTQIALALAELGYRVTYLYGGNSEWFENQLVEHGKSLKLDISSTHPLITLRDLTNFDLAEYKSERNTLGVIMESAQKQFFFYAKELKTRGAIVMYDVIDDWTGDWGMTVDFEAEEAAVRLSDIVAAVVPTLQKKYEEKYERPLLYLPNAVNLELFDWSQQYTRPIDLPSTKTVLYSGYMAGTWFDWALLAATANALPDWTFVMIGEHTLDMGADYKIDSIPNIKFLGLKPQTSLPAYIQHADLTFMPWKVDTISLGASPLKVYEYIAMGKRVVAPKLDQLADMPNVYLSNTPEDFAENIRTALSKPIDYTATAAFSTRNSWEARMLELLHAVENIQNWRAPAAVYTDKYWSKNSLRDLEGFNIGTTNETSDVVNVGVVRPDYSAGNHTVVFPASQDSATFYFWAEAGLVNYTTVIPTASFLVRLALNGSAVDGQFVSYDDRKELFITFECLQTGQALTGFSFNLPDTGDSIEVFFVKDCVATPTVPTGVTSETIPPSTATESTEGSTTVPSGGSLTTGELIGIIVGSIAFFLLIVGLGIFMYRRNRKGYEEIPEGKHR